MSVVHHVKAFLALTFITLNLAIWILPLAVLALVRLASPGERSRRAMAAIYRAAVRLDDLWLNLMGTRWRLNSSGEAVGRLTLPRDEPVLVICNHRSWADIFIVQSVIVRDGPIVVFLAKRELAWIPILGIIFLAFDFPILRRRTRTNTDSDARRRNDIERVDAACGRLNDAPAALLSFAEGTRFTQEKHARDPRYANLLAPRRGGIEAFVRAVPTAKVVDLTLDYPGDPGFWGFLAGRSGDVMVDVDIVDLPASDVGSWLNARWSRKDEILERRSAGTEERPGDV